MHTTTPMTRDAARRIYFDTLRARCGPEWADFHRGKTDTEMETDAWRVDETIDELDALIAKGEEVERVPILLRAIEHHAQRAVAPVQMLRKALLVIQELSRDPGFYELVRDAVEGNSRHIGRYIERGRNAAQRAREAVARGEAYLEAQRRGGDAAAEAWAAAVVDLERLCSESAAESKRCAAWYQAACAAAKARDAAGLAQLRKAAPPAPALDAVGALPRDRPFAAFEREFPPATLPKPLQDTIRRDSAKLVPKVGQARAAALARAMLLRQVDGLRIEPADARKALAVLKWPAAALDGLRKALAEPAGRREKALEALARRQGAAGSGRQFVAQLQKAGVL